MNKYIAWKRGSALAGLFLLSANAYSIPFVYEVGALWQDNTDLSTYGIAAVLFITVDNGSLTNSNQTFTWQDITNIHYSTYGGTYGLNSAGNQYTSSSPLPPVSFLTTDATGLGTLDIDNSGANPEYFNTQDPEGGYAQFGAGTFNNIAYYNGQSRASFHAGPSNWVTTAYPVPEPESYVMMLAGLGLVGAVATRRRNEAQA